MKGREKEEARPPVHTASALRLVRRSGTCTWSRAIGKLSETTGRKANEGLNRRHDSRRSTSQIKLIKLFKASWGKRRSRVTTEPIRMSESGRQ